MSSSPTRKAWWFASTRSLRAKAHASSSILSEAGFWNRSPPRQPPRASSSSMGPWPPNPPPTRSLPHSRNISPFGPIRSLNFRPIQYSRRQSSTSSIILLLVLLSHLSIRHSVLLKSSKPTAIWNQTPKSAKSSSSSTAQAAISDSRGATYHSPGGRQESLVLAHSLFQAEREGPYKLRKVFIS